jgi:ATP adenylyltransferase
MLNKYPWHRGHLIVAPFRHVGELEKLEDEEMLDLQQLLQRSVRAVKKGWIRRGSTSG